MQVDDFVGDGGQRHEWRSAVAARIWRGRRVSSGRPRES